MGIKACIVKADARQLPLDDESVQMVVSSPPYWGLRAYDGDQGDAPFGQEPTVNGYIQTSVEILREIRRVLKKDGVCFWNVGDTFARDPKKGSRAESLGLNNKSADTASLYRSLGTLKPKDLALVPVSVAIAARNDGWWLRSDIIWAKGNPMPSSVMDRPTDCYEHIFMFTKSAKYYWDSEAAREVATRSVNVARNSAADKWKDWQTVIPLEEVKDEERDGPYRMKTKTQARYKHDKEKDAEIMSRGTRNLRDIWSINLQPTRTGHPATFPEELVKRCISLASKPGDVVMDVFGGSGTTAKVALEMGRNAVHSDLFYHDIAVERIRKAKTEEPVKIVWLRKK